MSDDSRPRLLIVEGKNDEHVINHIRSHCASDLDFRIENKGNIDQLIKAIGPEIKAPDRQALGILVDANGDPEARFQAICYRITEAGRERPTSYGQILQGPPRIGVWMMPDNTSPGELENFIEQLIPDGDPIWPLARKYIDNIPKIDRPFKSGKVLRAQIHAWLATRKQPRPMGQALTTGDLDVNQPLAQEFVGWLTQLFDPS